MSAIEDVFDSYYADKFHVGYSSLLDAARAELATLRATVATLEAQNAVLGQAVNEAHLAMVKIGNDLNWEYPADQQLADAINACIAAYPAQEEPEVTP
jgi:hypothetical protein